MVKVHSVSSTDELRSALQDAKDGDVIELQPGTYDELEITRRDGLSFETPVTIRSADPDDPAELTGLSLNSVKGLSFEGLVFDYTYTPGDHWLYTSPFEVHSSSDIAIRDSHFSGDRAAVDADPDTVNDVGGYGNARGFYARHVEDLVIENNEFEGFARGLQITQIEDVVVRGNEFHSQRMDHITVAEAKNLVIEDNYMHDFDAPPNATDHRDMIQFWTENTRTQTENVIIRDNVMVLGEEDLWTQSIFMSNRAVTEDGMDNMEYKNVEITGNVIVNGHKHGIQGGPYDGLLIANNTIVREEVRDNDGPLANPRIELDAASTGVTILDNIVSDITTIAEPYKGWTMEDAGWEIDGNILIQDEARDAPGWYGDVFINPAEGSRSDLANIQLRPDSPLDLDGKGAARLVYDATPEELTALIRAERADGNRAEFDFSAGFSAGPAGPLGPGTIYRWDFGDGETATGRDASHAFSAPGIYTVTLTVIDGNGNDDINTTQVEVAGPVLFDMARDGATLLDLEGAQSAEGGVYVFDSDRDHAGTDAETIAALAWAEDFRLELDIYSDDWSAGAGEVLRVHTGFTLATTSDGTVTFRVTPDDEKAVMLDTGAVLADGAWSAVTVRFFDGMLRLSVDGVLQAEAPVAGRIGAIEGRGLSLGNPFKAANGFIGQIKDLKLSARESLYDLPDIEDSRELSDLPAYLDFDFDLTERAETGSVPLTLHDDAEFHADTGTLRFDGTGDWALLDAGMDSALQAQTTLSFDYQRDVADGSSARLVWNHRNFAVDAQGDGINLRVGLADGGFKQYRIDNLGLNDTDRHDVIAHVDEVTDLVQLIVDGTLVFSSTADDVQLTGPNGSGSSKWMIGGAWTGYLDGTVSDLRIDHDPWPPANMDVNIVPLSLFGNATFETTTGTLRFDGTDDWALLDGGEDTALQAQTTVSFAYQRDVADGASARLLWNHRNFAVDAQGDGISLRVGLADGGFKQYRFDDLGLNDTDRHEVTAHVDEVTDLVKLIVDDTLIFASTADDVQLTGSNGSGSSSWMIGGAWTGYLDGTVSDLRIETGPHDANPGNPLDWINDFVL